MLYDSYHIFAPCTCQRFMTRTARVVPIHKLLVVKASTFAVLSFQQLVGESILDCRGVMTHVINYREGELVIAGRRGTAEGTRQGKRGRVKYGADCCQSRGSSLRLLE